MSKLFELKVLSSKKPRLQPVDAKLPFETNDYNIQNFNSSGDNTVSLECLDNQLDYELDSEKLICLSDAFKIKGYKYVDQGDFKNALSQFIQARYCDPLNFIIHELIGQAYLELDLPFEAVKSIETAIKILPNWSDAYLSLARAQRELGELEKSLYSYNHYFRMLKDNNREVSANIQEEFEEVKSLQNSLNLKRLQIYSKLNLINPSNPKEIEAHTCIYNSTSRFCVLKRS